MKIKYESVYFKWGLTAVIVITFAILLFFSVYRIDSLLKSIGVITGILTPFIYGLVMAYLLCPIYNLVKRNSLKIPWPNIAGKNYSLFISKMFATTVALLFMFLIISGLLWMVIPQLIQSIMSIAKTLPDGINSFVSWFEKVVDGRPQLAGPIDSILQTAQKNFTNWVEATLIPNYQDIISGISNGVFGFLNLLKNFFIGVIICGFFLNSKEIFSAQIKKLLFAITSTERADSFLKGSSFVNKTFGGFVNGKLLDSLIIGILCFIVMSIFVWPYAALISVIIGVTNIIPFFGPFIGAVPSILLILMVDPTTSIYFAIFILILQQVDGNIIGPKILGGSTGISSFWVLFAIIVGGGVFGFIGMVIGIPLFAVIYTFICLKVNKRLEKKGFSTNLKDYKYIYVDKKDLSKESD